MIEKLKALYVKYREIIVYVFFGGLTTLVNYAARFVGQYLLFKELPESVLITTTFAWVVAVIFAFVVNKLFVFHSRGGGVGKLLYEMLSFFGCRLLSFFLDAGFMQLTVAMPGKEEDVVYYAAMVLISNVIVMIVNYVFSKLLVFRKEKNTDGK